METKSLLTSPSNVLSYYLKFPVNNLNFHWRWRWWDQIQAIFLNLFYFNLKFRTLSGEYITRLKSKLLLFISWTNFLLDLRRGLKKSSSIWTKFLSTYTSALSQKRRVLLAMIPLVLKTTWAQKVHFLLPPLALCRRSTMGLNQLWSRIWFFYLRKKLLIFSFYWD